MSLSQPMRRSLFSMEHSWSRRAHCWMRGSSTHVRHSLCLPHGTCHKSPSETFPFPSLGKTEDKTGERKMQKSLSNPTTFSLKTGIAGNQELPVDAFSVLETPCGTTQVRLAQEGNWGVLSPCAARPGAPTSSLRERKGGSSDLYSPAGRAVPADPKGANSTCSSSELPGKKPLSPTSAGTTRESTPRSAQVPAWPGLHH